MGHTLRHFTWGTTQIYKSGKMSHAIQSFVGFRAVAAKPSSTSRTPAAAGRGRLEVSANKKGDKRTQVMLLEDVKGFGQKGELKSVRQGFYRCYLHPKRIATRATEEVLAQLQAKEEAKQADAAQDKAKAEQLKGAFSMIGNLVIRRKTGANDEDDKIFGSVTAADVVEAVLEATNQTVDKDAVTVPDIERLGTYTATIQLHKEVSAEVTLDVTKAA